LLASLPGKNLTNPAHFLNFKESAAVRGLVFSQQSLVVSLKDTSKNSFCLFASPFLSKERKGEFLEVPLSRIADVARPCKHFVFTKQICYPQQICYGFMAITNRVLLSLQ